MLIPNLWLFSVPALIIATFHRRSVSMYRVFMRAHYLPILFAVAGMIHGSNWFYVAPPMLLWYADHLARVRRKARLPNSIAVSVHDDVVKMDFPPMAHPAGLRVTCLCLLHTLEIYTIFVQHITLLPQVLLHLLSLTVAASRAQLNRLAPFHCGLHPQCPPRS